MRTRPKGEKRPADIISASALIERIATGQVKDMPDDDGNAAQESGRMGGNARATSGNL